MFTCHEMHPLAAQEFTGLVCWVGLPDGVRGARHGANCLDDGVGTAGLRWRYRQPPDAAACHASTLAGGNVGQARLDQGLVGSVRVQSRLHRHRHRHPHPNPSLMGEGR
ncbi:hypothetical protein XAC3810_90063 [Xanthomonas citri pv. citri]|nr:hypothetical protein XAC1083_100063 [Xanthomonas citri pv. citri]CEE42469.1 hypothetical protein XAC9322_80063 [Xanthomonas citri pv. citri]CEE49263.1 hypothetical protein XAC3810_90063 [Xanthomonas citri pv. citri]CEE55490.1 hypothetical protein XAC2852_120048 [Xanthomonas citri pv. citri]CEE61793.1 hypothetical protein XACLC80_100064 [Xanthomonas citri pv. citri]